MKIGERVTFNYATLPSASRQKLGSADGGVLRMITQNLRYGVQIDGCMWKDEKHGIDLLWCEPMDLIGA